MIAEAHSTNDLEILNCKTSVTQLVLPDIDDSEDLGGFSLLQFRHLIEGLLVFCLYHCWLEDSADRIIGLDNPIGSNPLVMQCNQFIEWMAECAKLPKSIVKKIVELLAFDAKQFHARVTYSPLVISPSRNIFISPRLITLLDVERLLVGALNTSGQKHVYDSLVTRIEQRQLPKIRDILEPVEGWYLICDRMIRSGDTTIKPDFVIWEPTTERILIIEYKHTMEASGVVEAYNRLKEFRKWKSKIERYVAFLKKHPDSLSSAFSGVCSGIEPHSVDHLILTRWPLPLPMDENSAKSVFDLTSLQRLLSDSRHVSIENVVNWAQKRPDVVLPKSLRFVRHEIRVGNWTYCRQSLARDD